jgi:hypothetical protein
MRTMVNFQDCPECGVAYGIQGMARHRKQAHGVTPAVRGAAKPKALTTGSASALRCLIANTTATAADVLAPTALDTLVKAGFATKSGETYTVTEAGIARLSR